MINIENHQHYHHLFGSLFWLQKVTYKCILFPCLIGLITSSIGTIKASNPWNKRVHQPFQSGQGQSSENDYFLWAIVIIATILLIFLSLCFCRCYYRYKEICDQQGLVNQHQQHNLLYLPDHHLQPSPTPSTSTTTTPQPPPYGIQLTNLIPYSADPALIVHHLHYGRSSIKIEPQRTRKESKIQRHSSLRSSV